MLCWWQLEQVSSVVTYQCLFREYENLFRSSVILSPFIIPSINPSLTTRLVSVVETILWGKTIIILIIVIIIMPFTSLVTILVVVYFMYYVPEHSDHTIACLNPEGLGYHQPQRLSATMRLILQAPVMPRNRIYLCLYITWAMLMKLSMLKKESLQCYFVLKLLFILCIRFRKNNAKHCLKWINFSSLIPRRDLRYMTLNITQCVPSAVSLRFAFALKMAIYFLL